MQLRQNICSVRKSRTYSSVSHTPRNLDVKIGNAVISTVSVPECIKSLENLPHLFEVLRTFFINLKEQDTKHHQPCHTGASIFFLPITSLHEKRTEIGTKR